MRSIFIFCLAAIFEIAGCFAFWVCLREHRSRWWMAPGSFSLLLFAYLLTKADTNFAGRAYAAYGGIYVTASLVWLWLVEGTAPTRYDLLGASLCIVGTGIILFAQKHP